MSIDKAAAMAGVKMDGDGFAPGYRTQKCAKRVIAAFRAMEAASNEDRLDLERDNRKMQQKCLQQQEEMERLRAELLVYKLKEKTAAMHLSAEHQEQILALPAG